MYNGNKDNKNSNYGKYGFRKPQMLSKSEFEHVKKAEYIPNTMFDYLREYEKYANKADFFSRLKVLYENKGIPEMTYKAVLQAIAILEDDNN